MAKAEDNSVFLKSVKKRWPANQSSIFYKYIPHNHTECWPKKVLQRPCHNSHQIFGVDGLLQFFRSSLDDSEGACFSYFQHLLEVGILFQIFHHGVTALRPQHNLEVDDVHLQICRFWGRQMTLALETPRQFASPEIEPKHISKICRWSIMGKIWSTKYFIALKKSADKDYPYRKMHQIHIEKNARP